MLNLKLRKHFFNKNVSINLIGTYADLTYPINHLGNSIKTLINIVEGKNSFCKQLRKAKNPLIIVGSEFALRLDAKLIQNLIRFLSKKSIVVFKNFIGLNFVHSNITQSHFCELGLSVNAKSKSYLISSKKQAISQNDLLIANNITEISKKIFKNNNFFCSLNTHRFENDQLFEYNLPINSFYERDSLNINVEGVVQKGFKSKTPLISARNSEDIFKALISLDTNVKNKKNSFTKK
jgi:NADH dehydrogenase/NADH:ubiquinone oxidoreductase subunit G